MIRVVHVLTRTNIGGPSVMLVDLLDGLDTRQFTQTVLRGAPVESEGDYLAGRSVNAEVITVGGLRRSIGLAGELRSLVALVRELRRLKPDVVHTHMAKAGVIGRIAAVIARVPVRVHTYHGHLLHGYFSPLVTRLVVVVERLLRRITSHAFVVGGATRTDLLQAKLVSDRTSSSIMPAARSLSRHDRVAARSELRLPNEGIVVGFVGRLTGVKRPDRFLKVAAALPTATHVIVGDGPLRSHIEERAGAIPNVILRDWHRDIALVLSAIDILVLTSDNEGVPLSLIEAATMGVPVVTTNVGSVSEIVEHGKTGFVVDSDEELISAVSRLIDDADLRASMGSTGAAHIASRCSMSRYLSAHAETYNSLVER